ncbi:MAG: radical SAM protein [Desulfobacterales bacterium]|nr:radical SAM protein [Desulfobacterales bacterium]
MGHIYTKMKIFHFKDKIDSLPESTNKILSPIHIRIKPTNLCNHNCRYCAYRTSGLQLGKDMRQKDMIPKNKMMEIIDDIKEMGVKAITFSGGGEPLCYPYLSEALKQLIKTEVKFAALTNGSLLRDELLEIFAYNATWLRVSIDGWNDESYSKYRQAPIGEFSKVMKNMENLKKKGGKCYLGVSIIIDQINAPHIYESIKNLKNIGVDSVKASTCIVSNNESENNKYHQQVLTIVKDQINRSVIDFAGDGFEINDAYHEIDLNFKKEYAWCPFCQILPVIGADLNIYSCQDKAYNLKEGCIGSIKNQDLKTFWFNDKAKFFKINPSYDCQHHCIANIKNSLLLEYLNVKQEHLGFV